MHGRVSELVELLHDSRRGLLASLEPRTLPELTARPAPEAWSALEVVDHVRRVERGIARVLTGAAEAARAAGPERETSSVIGRLDPLRISAPVRPVSAPQFAWPTGELELDELVRGLVVAREALLAAIAPLDGLALGEVRVPHALLGDFDLYQWILFASQHEQRHTRQIERAREVARAQAVSERAS